MIERQGQGVRPTRYSRLLSHHGLRAGDVRQFSRVFIISDAHAAQAIMAAGIRGKDIKALQSEMKIGRREAVRESTNFLTDAEFKTIFEIKVK